MSEPTREEKLKTIRLANQIFRNMWEQNGHLFREFAEYQKEVLANAPPGFRRPAKPQPVPAEDPAERARLLEVLAEAGKKETK